MPLPFYNWSRTAASNATADSTVNWAEGQAPSTVNDSGRAMMASAAGFRDDISGAIATGGTSTAYTVTSYQVFSSLATMAGQMIAFTPHATNGATVTLNVDGLGAKPLRSSPGVELPAGTLVLGTPYTAVYNNSTAVWYLQNFYGNPYNIPIGGLIDYSAATAPNSSFVLPYGQAISRTTYSVYFALVSTAWGVGDGTTTFNVPDLRGRVVAGVDNMGGVAASRLTGGSLAAALGAQTQTLATANLPAYTPAGTVASSGALVSLSAATTAATGAAGTSIVVSNAASGTSGISNVSGDVTVTSTFTGTAQGGTSSPVTTLPPTVVMSKILRII